MRSEAPHRHGPCHSTVATSDPWTCARADVRDIDGERRDGVVAGILQSAAEIAARRKVRWSHRVINQDPPATCSNEVVGAIEGAAGQLGLRMQRMVSRAYHDSLFMARIAPTAMIFIPCRLVYGPHVCAPLLQRPSQSISTAGTACASEGSAS